MKRPKEILRYPENVLTFHNASLVVYTNLANSTLGAQGIRQTGSYIALWGTPTSESWTSGTKNITGVEVIYTTLTTASVIQVSLQNVTQSSGVRIPDGTRLAVWSGSSSFGNVGRLITHSFASPYTISTGSTISTVWEYLDRGPTLPQLQIRALASYTTKNSIIGATVRETTASQWIVSETEYLSPIRFVCSDGSKLYYQYGNFGMTSASFLTNDYLSTATGTGIDSGDERGMLWIPKNTYDIVEAKLLTRMVDPTTDMDMCLYRDTTLLASESYNNSKNVSNNDRIGYGVKLTTPVRVYPGDNIRLTVKPRTGQTRWIRLSFITSADMNQFFGGQLYETNLSITNRVDEGAWNTPTGADSSYSPVQFYGYEVTGANLLSGSYVLSGSVVANNIPAQNATVRVMRSSDNTAASASTNVNGLYQFNLVSGSYHVMVEYESGSQKYNSLSYWDVSSD
jgi:hypothetical protein